MRAAQPIAESGEDLFQMASLSPSLTGLPMVVWISERGGARHDARVRVSLVYGWRARPDHTALVSLRPDVRAVAGPALDPRDLELVRHWVDLNRDALLAYRNGDLLTDEVIAKLRSVAAG
jgi:hypothetical protein